MTISACLIVKNEKDHIRDVLTSLKGFDEIVVVDTGSIDNTVEIAREFTDRVFQSIWEDDFSKARNYALEQCTGDWVLSIDGDEILEEGGLGKIRRLIENAGDDELTFSVKMIAKGTGAIHNLPRIFRNDGSVKWVGAAHETLSPIQANRTDIQIEYGSSTAHALDPDRMLRILEKQVNSEEGTPRDLYYYAREWYYRADYEKAGKLFTEYLTIATWIPEKADACLYLARCKFYTQKGNEARQACSEAIILNPDFKEALIFMAEMHFEPWKHKWERLASAATNEDVLFIRV